MATVRATASPLVSRHARAHTDECPDHVCSADDYRSSQDNDEASYIEGVEYKDGPNVNKDASCSVCQAAPGSMMTYVQWGRQTCTNHTTEYAGLMMSTSQDSNDNAKSEWICVNSSREGVGGTRDGALYDDGQSDNPSPGNNGATNAKLYETEIRAGTGHHTEYPGGYPDQMEVGCAVCSTTAEEGAPYVRWGTRTCGRDIDDNIDTSVKKL